LYEFDYRDIDMIKRFIKQKGMTVTKAVNSHGQLCSAIRTVVANDCCWMSEQHVRLMMSTRYQDYLQINDEHLSQITIEFGKQYSAHFGNNAEIDMLENAGLLLFQKSVVTCSDITDGYGDLESCIPFPNGEGLDLVNDIIRYRGEFVWLKEHHALIPFGKQLYSNLVKEMERVFSGRVPGRQIWHTYKN
jgi:hypothetical protein